MPRHALIAAALALSCAAAQAAGDAPKLPADAAKLVDRLANCTHFAGEFNGDQSEHDRQVNKTLMELGCNRIDTDVAAMRSKYAGNAAVLQALDQAEAP